MPSEGEASTEGLLAEARGIQEANAQVGGSLSAALKVLQALELGWKDMVPLPKVDSRDDKKEETEIDPFERRRRIILHNAQQLEKDAQGELQQLFSTLYENEVVTQARKAVTVSLAQSIKKIELHDKEWFADEPNAATAIREMAENWCEVIARGKAIKDACGMSFEDLQWKIQGCDRRLRNLKTVANADAALAHWEAEDDIYSMDLEGDVTDEQLMEYVTKNKVELEAFMTAEQELLGSMDDTYGETLRGRQENFLFLKQAVKAVEGSAQKKRSPGERLSDEQITALSEKLFQDGKIALRQVTSTVRQRMLRYKKMAPLSADLLKQQKIVDIVGVRGVRLADTLRAQQVQLNEFKNILRLMTGGR